METDPSARQLVGTCSGQLVLAGPDASWPDPATCPCNKVYCFARDARCRKLILLAFITKKQLPAVPNSRLMAGIEGNRCCPNGMLHGKFTTIWTAQLQRCAAGPVTALHVLNLISLNHAAQMPGLPGMFPLVKFELPPTHVTLDGARFVLSQGKTGSVTKLVSGSSHLNIPSS